jgi:predicted Rossmann fold flavoprotein
MGASCIGYDIALSFGHTIIPTKPGLVPLIVQADTFPYSDLAGLSIQSEIQTEESPIFKEGLLFTHKGLSGPAILQASSYMNHTNSVTINTLIDPSNYAKIAKGDFGKMDWKNALSTIFPKRFAYAWAQYHKQSETYSHYSEKTRKIFADQLMNWQPIIAGNEGYSKAEVTVGGVNTKELSSKTMMSNKIPNLYFIGEVVDVTGHLGGYNFQWAWASANAISISSN